MGMEKAEGGAGGFPGVFAAAGYARAADGEVERFGEAWVAGMRCGVGEDGAAEEVDGAGLGGEAAVLGGCFGEVLRGKECGGERWPRGA